MTTVEQTTLRFTRITKELDIITVEIIENSILYTTPESVHDIETPSNGMEKSTKINNFGNNNTYNTSTNTTISVLEKQDNDQSDKKLKQLLVIASLLVTALLSYITNDHTMFEKFVDVVKSALKG